MDTLNVRRAHERLVAGVAAALAAVAGPLASAADIRIDVTGSNIKRVEGEGALPVSTITRADIERSGATSVPELLQLVSANNSLNAVNIVNSVGAVTFSAQTASLRGLGGGRTLVLLNGQRIDSFAGEIQGVQGVNLSTIPFAAIERVEVLKDGASAIYGSDAIGGVINFITRADYTGGEATALYGAPTRGGGGEQWQASGAVGFGDLAKDRYNVFMSLSYNEQKSLDQRDRGFSNSSFLPDIGLDVRSAHTLPGFITTGGIGAPGAPDHCAPSTFYPDAGLCLYDPSQQPGVNMLPDDKLWNFFGTARYKINSDWQAFVTGLYARQQTRLVIQPGAISGAFSYGPLHNTPSAITLQPSSPFYPHDLAAAAGVDGEPLDVLWRSVELGGRDTTDTNENAQIVAGVSGTWRDWDFDGAFSYSEGRTSQRLNGGFQLLPPLLALLNSGNVNLFGPNTPDVHQELLGTSFVGNSFDGTSKNYGLRGKATGEIWKLPAGSLAVAVGAEARKETLSQTPAPELQLGNVTGFGGAIGPVDGSRTAWAAFGELNAPLIRSLELNAAVRYDHYSDFGGTTNPKFSVRWQPARSLLVRGSWGSGFLAPSLFQLRTPPVGGVTQPVSDPLRCPVTNATGLDCNAQFGVVFGGNAALKPEQSEQTTLGVVVEPFAGASFSLDWFKINLKNAITAGIPVPTILGDLDQFGGLVTRGAPDPAFPNLPGRIASILQTYINIGAEHIQGVDLEARYRAPMMRWGRLTFNINGTYYLHYDNQNRDGTWTGIVGSAFGSTVTGVIPRWKHYATLAWDQGPWSATLAQLYQGSYTDSNPIDADGNLRTVGSLSLWDLQGTYAGFRNLKLTLGVKNLFDRNPPKSNTVITFITGFDPTYYDPRARFVYASINYRFN